MRDGDPLADLISGTDRSLLLDRLFDGTRTHRSRMGAVRHLWRTHLGLETDKQLRDVLTGLRVVEGHRSLDDLRDEINFRARAVGVLACHKSDSDFRFDELARQLKVRKIGALSRELLLEICGSERLLADAPPPLRSARPVAIRSFIGAAGDQSAAAPEDTLLLTDLFTERYLRNNLGWQQDVRPRVERFLEAAAQRGPGMRLSVEAHASIAFLAGSLLGPKSGCDVTLVQKGRVGARDWRADDELDGLEFDVSASVVGRGPDLLVAIGATHDVRPAAEAYARKRRLRTGRLLDFRPAAGPGGSALAGGAHAARLADQVTRKIRAARSNLDAVVHLFAACPNALMYFLGQQNRGIAPIIVYEYDFDRRGGKSYQPSFLID